MGNPIQMLVSARVSSYCVISGLSVEMSPGDTVCKSKVPILKCGMPCPEDTTRLLKGTKTIEGMSDCATPRRGKSFADV
jgi:hypothetical protein